MTTRRINKQVATKGEVKTIAQQVAADMLSFSKRRGGGPNNPSNRVPLPPGRGRRGVRRVNNGNQTPVITPAGRFLRRAGAIAGGFLGNSQLGSQLGAGISRIFGQGDYAVQQNSLMSGPPSFSPMNEGIRFTHREYITDILSTTNYNVQTYRIQPNSTATFPWLAQLASSFEQYRINGMVFYLNTTSGNAVSSTNNSMGVWGITTVYDPSKPALSSKIQAEEYKGCTAGVPSSSILHPVECAPNSAVLDRYYVDYYNNITGENLKFYDHGTVNVFTSGQQQAGVNIGELWVSYDITFFNARVMPAGEQNVADHYKLTGASITATNPVGTTNPTVPSTGSLLGTTITPLGAGTARLNFQAGSANGYYLINYQLSTGASLSGMNMSVGALSTNVQQSTAIFASGFNNYNAVSGTTQMCYSWVVNKTDTAAGYFTFAANLMASGSAGTALDIFVVPLGTGISADQPVESETKLFYKFYKQLLELGVLKLPLESVAHDEERKEDEEERLRKKSAFSLDVIEK